MRLYFIFLFYVTICVSEIFCMDEKNQLSSILFKPYKFGELESNESVVCKNVVVDRQLAIPVMNQK